MRNHRLGLVAVAAAIVATVALSATWVVREGHRTMVVQVQASEHMAAAERAAVLAQTLRPFGRDVTLRSLADRRDAEVMAGGHRTGRTLADLSPELLGPLTAFEGTTSLVTSAGEVLVSNAEKTAPRVQSPAVLRLLAAGRGGAATYHSALLGTDRIGVVAPVVGTDLAVVIGADAAIANRPATALAHRLVAALAVTVVVVGGLAALLLLLVQAGRRRLRAERDTAATLARTDALTHLPNRRAFEEAVATIAGGGRRMGVVAIDLDDLKRVNDVHGHERGDEALRLAAAAMGASIRPGDLLARLGGDEFVVLLPGTSAEEARTVARRMEAAVAATTLDGHGPLAISTGVAAGPGHVIADTLWEADVEMYRAKRSRKEHVTVGL